MDNNSNNKPNENSNNNLELKNGAAQKHEKTEAQQKMEDDENYSFRKRVVCNSCLRCHGIMKGDCDCCQRCKNRKK